MLNEKKVLVMAKLARMEQRKDKFFIQDYYISDFVRSNLLKTFVRITFGYAVLVVMAILYRSEYLIANAVTLDYKKIMVLALGIYFLLLLVYLFGTVFACVWKYKQAGKYITRYEKGLSLLQKLYRNEQERKRGGQAS